MWLRIAMTIEAPAHKQRLVLIGEWHFIHAPMALDAADPFVHMNAVVEIRELSQIVNSLPGDRSPCSITGSDGLERRGTDPNLLMAVHANFGGRNASERSCL